MKRSAWAIFAFLTVTLPLVLWVHPVVAVAGPGWVGHYRIEWNVLHFVPLWRLDGRTTHLGVLALEMGAGVLAGILVFASLRERNPEGKSGTL